MIVSPLAPEGFPEIPEIAGVRIATAAAGVRYEGRDDVMLAEFAPGTAVAGTFTQSATRSAPVLDCEGKLGAEPEGGAAFLVNAGNANAFTGRAGDASVFNLCRSTSLALEISEDRVFTASTGVIGERLPDARITEALVDLTKDLRPSGFEAAARAIMTTDTYPKGSVRAVEGETGTVHVAGIAKGSGMIAPDMATMLCFVFTDAYVPQGALQAMLGRCVRQTFNCITVDSDTSTSDTVLVAATGHGAKVDQREFEEALHAVLLDLAHQVVRDGEGATKFVTVEVTGANSDRDAARAARAIADSPLVKTAIAGEDPNWGRIVMAVGKSGARADRDALSIRFGDVLVAEKGWVAEGYREEQGAAVMREPEITLAVDLGVGEGRATIWTCDLTARYVEINADYRS